jgi:DNA-binding response OmpR family regulator
MVADIGMPGMSGIELASAARLVHPKLPVLFVTGFAGTALPVEESGPDRLLRKPFRAAELIARVALMLEGESEGAMLARRRT